MKRNYFAAMTRITLSLLLPLLVISGAASKTSAQGSYRSGQHVEPAYEGWRANNDGTYSFIFGYFNENWEETPDIPVGENNYFSPGEIDRGQPTYFLPRRNRFTFEVVVPADWGDKELVWTLTSPNGVSRKAYATLAADYTIDNIIIASETGSLGAGTSSPESRSNRPPQLTILGDLNRRISVEENLPLRAQVNDDGLPTPGRVGARGAVRYSNEEEWLRAVMRPPVRTTVSKMNGLFLSWNKYRGPGDVTFDPPQVKVWEDTRTSAYSPWGPLYQPVPVPEDGVYDVEISFSEPGTYVLWGRADDGGLFHDQFVEVTVLP